MGEQSRMHLSRASLLRRLAAMTDGGETHYLPPGAPLDVTNLGLIDDDGERAGKAIDGSTTGAVAFVRPRDGMIVVPPFPVERAEVFLQIEPAPLVELLDRRRSVAVLLLKLGGFSVGFFRGDALVESKTGQRFVKNRHRKGGQSQRRFDRIREKQVDQLFDTACETAREKLAPYDAEIQHLFLGGTRQTVAAFRKECAWIERLGPRLMARLLPVPGDPRKSSLEAMPREIWSSDVYLLGRQPDVLR